MWDRFAPTPSGPLHLGAVLLCVACGPRVASTTPPLPSEPPVAPSTPAAPSPATTTGRPLERERAQSIFAELGRLGAAPPDLPTAFPARVIDRDKDQPLGVSWGLTLEDAPVFWLQDGVAVVDAAWFTDLTVADATNMTPGDRTPIGHLIRPAPGATVARLLVEADVVLTWAHIGSTLQQTDRSVEIGGHAAHFSGEHVYFTNRENHDSVDFVIEIDSSGSVSVVDATR